MSKYLMQASTGDVYPNTQHLAARGDMVPYDPRAHGRIVDGKASNFVDKAQEPELEPEAPKETKKADK